MSKIMEINNKLKFQKNNNLVMNIMKYFNELKCKINENKHFRYN